MFSIVVLPWACALSLAPAPAEPPTATSNGWTTAEANNMDGHTVPAEQAGPAPAGQDPAPDAAQDPAPGPAPQAAAAVAVAPPTEPELEPRYGNRAPNTVYIEGAGPALLYSVNYDRILHKFFSVRAGFSYIGLRATAQSGDAVTEARLRLINVPVLANVLLGRKGHNFEAGAGINMAFAFGSATAGSGARFVRSSASAVTPIGTATLGYRYTPPKLGVSFRAGFSPLFTKDFFVPWGYLSVGVAF